MLLCIHVRGKQGQQNASYTQYGRQRGWQWCFVSSLGSVTPAPNTLLPATQMSFTLVIKRAFVSEKSGCQTPFFHSAIFQIVWTRATKSLADEDRDPEFHLLF